MENEIQTLSRALFKGETPPPGSFAQDGAGQAVLETRLSDIELQLRELTGKLEQQQFEMRALREQLEKASASAAPQGTTVYNKMGMPAGSSIYSDVASAVSPAQPPQPGLTTPAIPVMPPAGTSISGTPYGMQTIDMTPPASSVEQGGTLGTISSGDSGDPADLYETAFTHVRDKDFANAEKALADFIARYPNHALAPNARYWLGETFYVRADYEKAARTFAEAYQLSPKGPKAADNLLKMALSLGGMGKKEQACVALAQLRKEFGGTPSPVLDRATQEGQVMGCR